MLKKIKEKLEKLIDNIKEAWELIPKKWKIGIAVAIVLVIALSLA